jgi:uncharacterized protein (TIGR03435 family)
MEPAYDLVLARPDGQLGPGLSPSPVDCAAREQAISTAEARAIVAQGLRNASPEAPPAACSARSLNGVIEGDLKWPGALTMLIPFTIGRRVIDKTGLTGYYRVHLEIAVRQPGADSTAGDITDPPDLFTALPSQLGLKLEDSKINVNTLIVERLEKPTEN